jgi:hypothetical protein
MHGVRVDRQDPGVAPIHRVELRQADEPVHTLRYEQRGKGLVVEPHVVADEPVRWRAEEVSEQRRRGKSARANSHEREAGDVRNLSLPADLKDFAASRRAASREPARPDAKPP